MMGRGILLDDTRLIFVRAVGADGTDCLLSDVLLGKSCTCYLGSTIRNVRPGVSRTPVEPNAEGPQHRPLRPNRSFVQV